MRGSLGYRLFVRIFAKDLVRDGFQSVLSRPADAQGAAAYNRSLGKRGDLAGFLAELRQSGEGRAHAIKALAPDLAGAAAKVFSAGGVAVDSAQLSETLTPEASLERFFQRLFLAARGTALTQAELALAVRVVYRGLLAREPDPAAMDHYSAALAATGDLAGFLRDVAASAEFKALPAEPQMTGIEAQVRAIFISMLGREPEPEALEGYAQLARAQGGVGLVAEEVGRSDEHFAHVLVQRSAWAVQAVFNGLLGRSAEPAAEQAYVQKLAQTRDLAGLIDEIAGSREHRDRVLRVRRP